jgi:hypothetical protein
VRSAALRRLPAEPTQPEQSKKHQSPLAVGMGLDPTRIGADREHHVVEGALYTSGLLKWSKEVVLPVIGPIRPLLLPGHATDPHRPLEERRSQTVRKDERATYPNPDHASRVFGGKQDRIDGRSHAIDRRHGLRMNAQLRSGMRKQWRVDRRRLNDRHADGALFACQLEPERSYEAFDAVLARYIRRLQGNGHLRKQGGNTDDGPRSLPLHLWERGLDPVDLSEKDDANDLLDLLDSQLFDRAVEGSGSPIDPCVNPPKLGNRRFGQSRDLRPHCDIGNNDKRFAALSLDLPGQGVQCPAVPRRQDDLRSPLCECEGDRTSYAGGRACNDDNLLIR